MKIKDKLLSIFLILIIIGLVEIIGFFGYTIYQEFVGEGNIKLSLGGEAGYPTNETKNILNEQENIEINTSNIDGIESSSDKKSGYRHLYNQLDKYSQIIYDKLYKNKDNLKTGTYQIEFGETFSEILSKENGDEELQRYYQSAIEAFLYENPEVFYIDAQKMYINIEKITKLTKNKYNVYINNGSKTNYYSEGIYSKEDIDRYENEINQVTNIILSKVQGKSDYEKIKIIHDYLIDNIEYDSTLNGENIYNIYGALVEKSCVCEGYAKAFQYLMNEIDIDNVIVIGTATNSNNQTENHAWNYVKLEENWYAIDVTWDDPVIIGGGKISNKIKYKYFLRGSNTLFENHVESSTFTEGGQIFTYPTLSTTDYE